MPQAKLPAIGEEVPQALSELPPVGGEVGATGGNAMNFAVVNGQRINLDDSATKRFLTNFGELINPVSIVTGVAQAIAHPIDTGTAILKKQGEQFGKAAEEFRQGRYSEATGHAAAGVLPIVGPLAAEAGEQIGAGDIAGGLGKTAGLLVPLGAAEGAAKVGSKLAPAAAADALEAGAAARVAETITPKVGANKIRFANTAERVAPQLAKELPKTWSRAGLQSHVETQLAAAEAALDEAANSRLAARSFPTNDIISGLLAKRRRLTAEAVEGSSVPRETVTRNSAILDESGTPIEVSEGQTAPIGRDVVPSPNATRVAQIDKAIDEIRRLGTQARYEPLRRIREAYDAPAKAMYHPSMTADFLAKKGEALGAADVTSVLRERLGRLEPETAAANATYALYRNASDVMKALEETERARPKVGRQIMGRLTGSLVGEHAAGLPGAATGFLLGPLVDQALSAGWTSRLQTARLMSDLATSIRSGDVSRATSLSFRLRQLVKQGEAVTARALPTAAENQEETPPATVRR